MQGSIVEYYFTLSGLLCEKCVLPALIHTYEIPLRNVRRTSSVSSRKGVEI